MLVQVINETLFTSFERKFLWLSSLVSADWRELVLKPVYKYTFSFSLFYFYFLLCFPEGQGPLFLLLKMTRPACTVAWQGRTAGNVKYLFFFFLLLSPGLIWGSIIDFNFSCIWHHTLSSSTETDPNFFFFFFLSYNLPTLVIFLFIQILLTKIAAAI